MATGNNANIGFEKQIWDAACVLWGHIPAAEYRKVIVGLIFLRYISSAFEKSAIRSLLPKATALRMIEMLMQKIIFSSFLKTLVGVRLRRTLIHRKSEQLLMTL